MGWTCTHKGSHESAADYIKDHVLVWKSETHNYRVLDGGVVKFRTYYGAVEKVEIATNKRQVFAVIILLSYKKNDYYNFCYKDMSEDMGPCESECPERILKLLTRTESEYANEWRERCWANIAARQNKPKIEVDSILRYGGNDYKVIKSLGRRGFMVLSQTNGQEYRMRSTQAREAEIVKKEGM